MKLFDLVPEDEIKKEYTFENFCDWVNGNINKFLRNLSSYDKKNILESEEHLNEMYEVYINALKESIMESYPKYSRKPYKRSMTDVLSQKQPQGGGDAMSKALGDIEKSFSKEMMDLRTEATNDYRKAVMISEGRKDISYDEFQKFNQKVSEKLEEFKNKKEQYKDDKENKGLYISYDKLYNYYLDIIDILHEIGEDKFSEKD